MNTPLAFANLFKDPLARNGLALLVNTGVTGVLGFAYWILAARLFPAEAVGRAGALISASTLLASLGQLNLGGTLLRFLPVAGGESRRLVCRVYGIAVASSVSLTAVVLVGVYATAPSTSTLRLTRAEATVFVAAVLATVVFGLQDHVLIGLRRAPWVPVENGLFGVCKIALLFVAAPAATSFAVFASWSVPFAILVPGVTVLLFLGFLPARGPPSATSPNLGRMVRRFATGDAVAGLANQAWTYLVPVLVLAILGARVNAQFYAAYLFSSTIDQVAQNYAAGITVEGGRDGANLRRLAARTAKHLTLLLLPIVFAMLLLSRLLLSGYGRAYVPGTACLQLLLVACLPRAVVAVFGGVQRARGLTGRNAALQSSVLIANIGLTLPLVAATHQLVTVGLVVLCVQVVAAALVLPELMRLPRGEIRSVSVNA